jgi:hypothetical protein
MLKNITKDFPDVKEALLEHKKAQLAMRKADRKLVTLRTKYNFLEVIIGVGVNDTKLGDALKHLLKEAGFEKVVHYVSPRIKPKREDLLAYSNDDLLVIEVKGLNAPNPSFSDLSQVAKYIPETKNRQSKMNVTGITIINHDKKRPTKERHAHFYDAEKDKDAKNMNFGFISTIDLVIGFWKLKTNEINFEQFKTRLQGTGFITFDSNGGKTRRQIGL